MDIFRSAMEGALEGAERILLAGAGGGYDVFGALPLYFSMAASGRQVFLSNLSFTPLAESRSDNPHPHLWRVRASDPAGPSYFPELYLSQWLADHGYPDEIYAFERVGVDPLREAYAHLREELDVDAVIAVDGGTDILMRGNEAGLGTPEEDMSTLAALRGIPSRTFVACIGFGIDAFHGVCHAQFLENVAALDEAGGYLGLHSIHLSRRPVELFADALDYAHSRMPRESIVQGSILSALEGRFGDVHRTDRTRSSRLFINPLMPIYWYFDLDAVATRCLYLDHLEGTRSALDVALRIAAFRRTVDHRPPSSIPV